MAAKLAAEVVAPDGTRYPTSKFRRKANTTEAAALRRVFEAAGDPKSYLQGEQHVEVENSDAGTIYWILDLPPGYRIVPKKHAD